MGVHLHPELPAMAGRKPTIPYPDLLRFAREQHASRPAGPILSPGELKSLASRHFHEVCSWPTAEAVLDALDVEASGVADRLGEIRQPELRRAVEAAWLDGSSLKSASRDGGALALDERGLTPSMAAALADASDRLSACLAQFADAAGAALRAGQAQATSRLELADREMALRHSAMRSQLATVEAAADEGVRRMELELSAQREDADRVRRAFDARLAEERADRMRLEADVRVLNATLVQVRSDAQQWEARHESMAAAHEREQEAAAAARERLATMSAEAAATRAHRDLLVEQSAALLRRCETAEEARLEAERALARLQGEIAKLEALAAPRERRSPSPARHQVDRQQVPDSAT